MRKLIGLTSLALLFAIPLSGCEINVSTSSGTKHKSTDDDDDEDVNELDAEELAEKVGKTLGIDLEYDDDYGDYYYEGTSTKTEKKTVQDIVNKLDYLEVIEDVATFTDEYYGISGYAALLSNESDTVEVYICAFKDDTETVYSVDVYDVEEEEVMYSDEVVDIMEQICSVLKLDTSDVEEDIYDLYIYIDADSTSQAVKNIADKLTFLEAEGTVQPYEDEDYYGNKLTGYEIYMMNKSGTVEVNIYSVDGDDTYDDCIVIDVYDYYEE